MDHIIKELLLSMSKLIYRNWAENRNEALPVGNGRIGAMIYGHPYTDTLSLNEETLWSGAPEGPITPYDPAVIAQAQALLTEEKYAEAEALLDEKLMRGVRTQTYLPLGKLRFELNHQRLLEVDSYRRELDLPTGIHSSDFAILCRQNSIDAQLETVHHRREAFVSLADDVLIYRFESDVPTSANVWLDLQLPGDIHYTGGRIFASGRCPTVFNEYDQDNILPLDPDKESIPYTVIAAFVTDGTVRGEGRSICLRGVKKATVLLSVATGFAGFDRQPISQGLNHAAIAEEKLAAALSHSYEELKRRHADAFSRQFSRTELVIGNGDLDDIPTDQRLRRIRHGEEDPGLASLLFDYGKYLTIASSQPGGQATNLQGIWCEDQLAPWNSNYTLNINTQMNYWATEMMDLPECHLPLMDMIRDLAQRGNNYGLRGWCAAHNTDIWRFNRMATRYSLYGLWDMGGVWLARHIYDHFRYTGDMEFLQEYMPVLRGIFVFLEDRLTADKNGHLILSPSTSPETRFLHNGKYCSVTNSAAMDQQIIDDYLQYMAELEPLVCGDPTPYQQMRQKLLPLKISREGCLLEYGREIQETDDPHQHLSHLYGLYPGNTIHPDTPLGDAARKALDDRIAKGGGVNGWANIWTGICYARFGDGENANARLRFMETDTVYPNLLNICPPFQIDGNFGVCALICEMLVQGDSNNYQLLPAIPKSWKEGHVRGLRLPGGKKLSFSWKDGIPYGICLE